MDSKSLTLMGAFLVSLHQKAMMTQAATTVVPEPTPENIGQEILDFISDHPEYVAMIGMGLLIIILVITAVCIICLLSGRRSEAYKK